VLLQLLVLVGMQVSAALPLWTGDEIRVKTVPVDPRSLLRGNYARLEYEFSRFPPESLSEDFLTQHIRAGQPVYVSLTEGADGLHQPTAVSLVQPAQGVFLRGRTAHRYQPCDVLAVNYGIEALFAPKEAALALERQLRTDAIAVLMVSANGHARIKAVEAANE